MSMKASSLDSPSYNDPKYALKNDNANPEKHAAINSSIVKPLACPLK